ncbi:thioesterase family protein [Parahaliea aestuarii]|uniref:Thioesterase family protein n=1 Tax=Parahaliea aestuarii TaxID=1852021 RepID=A0A5C8ZMX5_9GAMM|nr:thioesterase family protein [Parahaliea aestuarii]TXS89112.1 thioesterase family protein [Parahaliea aestuarii]
MGQFARETAVEKVAEGRWRGELFEGWRIGAVPNGGYVLALAGRALSEALPHRDPLAINAFYLAPTALGPIDCEVDVLRRGGNTSHASARLYQEGELKVVVTAAYTDLERLSGPNWSQTSAPDYPAFADCPVRGGPKLEFRQRVDLRLAEGGDVFLSQQPGGGGVFGGWVAHADGADPDPIGLLMFADAFPPPALDLVGLVGWVPTVELTVQLRALPAPGPIKARLASRFLTEGVIEEDGEYWDSLGNLVALSRQTAKVRLPK